ncbi:MAG TPA: hypothetical protein ENK18_10905 [Deltaproteobacteria bacterium]|nr:hypothetical protein [Deltaproteobacteria bacterium]
MSALTAPSLQGGLACPSGSSILDRALGIGGYPRGRIVAVSGPAASGKTTLALSSIAAVQGRGGDAAFVDAEGALDPRWARSLGVELGRLPICRPDHGEAALDMVRILVSSGGLDLVVIDSVAALTPASELTAGLGAVGSGPRARMLSRALCELAPILSREATVLLLLDQARGDPRRRSPGPGIAASLRASVRLAVHRTRIERRTRIGRRSDAPVDATIWLTIVGNKLSTASPPGELRIGWRGPVRSRVQR